MFWCWIDSFCKAWLGSNLFSFFIFLSKAPLIKPISEHICLEVIKLTPFSNKGITVESIPLSYTCYCASGCLEQCIQGFPKLIPLRVIWLSMKFSRVPLECKESKVKISGNSNNFSSSRFREAFYEFRKALPLFFHSIFVLEVCIKMTCQNRAIWASLAIPSDVLRDTFQCCKT